MSVSYLISETHIYGDEMERAKWIKLVSPCMRVCVYLNAGQHRECMSAAVAMVHGRAVVHDRVRRKQATKRVCSHGRPLFKNPLICFYRANYATDAALQ